MKATDFKPSLNRNILATMKKAAETMKPIDKLCQAIVTDEMSLKQSSQYQEPNDNIEDFGSGLHILLTMPLQSWYGSGSSCLDNV